MKRKPLMRCRFCLDTRRLTRRELARLRRLTPEARRRAVAPVLIGIEIDQDTRGRIIRAWRKE